MAEATDCGSTKHEGPLRLQLAPEKTCQCRLTMLIEMATISTRLAGGEYTKIATAAEPKNGI